MIQAARSEKQYIVQGSHRLRELNRQPGAANYATFRRGIEHEDPEICANVILGLTRLTNYLLDRQIARLESRFLGARWTARKDDAGAVERCGVARKGTKDLRSERTKGTTRVSLAPVVPFVP